MKNSRILILAVALVPAWRTTLPAAEGPAKPNIVLIVVDDLGYGDSTAYWKTDLQTPAMDAIARNGIRFTQFRVNPLCAPTRASIMTGLYSIETGLWRGPSERGGESEEDEGGSSRARRLKVDVRLLPQYLQTAGYATGMFGKWHLGTDPGNVPNVRGFDEFVGFLAGSHAYWLGRNSKILRNGQPFDAEGHATDLFADHAIEFIKANRARPFFCYLPFNAVHGPLRSAERPSDSARPEWLARYEEAGVPQPRRDYCAVMSHADQRIGDVLGTLRELNLEDRTLVICLSDNGGITHTYPSNNGPLRGGKGQTYEGGVRVPAVIQWPGVIPPASVSHAGAAHFDLFSTILDVAGVELPAANGRYPIHGLSLLPHLQTGGKSPLPDRYLFWDLYGQVAALHGRWKMVGQISNHHGKFEAAVREAESASFSLYNLDDDLGETADLAEIHPEVYRDLKNRHLQWLRQFAE